MNAWRLREALVSFRALDRFIRELSMEEVQEALRLETGSRRRKTIMRRLASRAAELARQQFKQQLKENVDGPSTLGHSDQAGTQG